MNLFKIISASLVLGIATSPILISSADAGSCRLRTGLYKHEDGNELRLYKLQDGGYQLKVGEHNYVVKGDCNGITFRGVRSNTGDDNRELIILKLKKRGSRYRYYEQGEYPLGEWYEYQ